MDEGSGAVPLTRDVEADIARDLSALSVIDRSRLYEGIHGVDPIIEETPAFIAERLHQLDSEVDRIDDAELDKHAYLLALEENPQYVESAAFRLQFLRADYFDAKKAARRMVEFMHWKLKMFGRPSLSRPLHLDDLDDECKQAVLSGKYQILPWRDNIDRAVVVDVNIPGGPSLTDDAAVCIKTLTYLAICLAEDEETQRRGVVSLVVLFSTQDGKLLSPDYHQRAVEYAGRMIDWWPVRLHCSHWCVNIQNPVFRSMVDLIRHLMTRDLRTRIRIHSGSSQECFYSLSQYGIPSDNIPLKSDGRYLKRENHIKWIKRRKKVDPLLSGQELQPLGLELPNRRDVLMGRSHICHQHPGNIAMRRLVQELHHLYVQNYEKRTEYVEMVVSTIEGNRGRFLEKNDDGWWTTVTAKVAENKVGAAFRTFISRQKRGESNNSSVSMLSVTSGFRSCFGDSHPIAKKSKLGEESDDVARGNIDS